MRFGTIEDGAATTVVVQASPEEAAAMPYPDLDVMLAVPEAQWRAAAAAALASGDVRPVASLSWLPPVRRPGKVLCVALNNSANPDRIMRGPSTPAMFVKPSSSLVGHGRPIVVKEAYGRVHPEPELAVVIGRGGADIAVEDALAHVFGYTIINDLTSPTMRDADTFHYRAIHPDPDSADGIRYVDSWVSYPARYKGSDTFGPLGPWVSTRDEIPDPHALRITCTHDGALVTDDNTANLRFSVAEVISFASEYLTLEAGDVIAMGTALKRSARGGAVQNVDLARLGGVIEVSIQGIGTLSNPVQRR
ncbi:MULTISPECIES: fumarylacetoacetate hydrolase family protein [Microbacterium]|uniref:FAA hydrolase family protein n=1 Tax=Microbacterium wangchenii TaxID=2541726 RepID=A0ABX5SPE0_9MICO|nr:MULTISPECIES: fumarylacetoacetate hydrolase family protein [Microbacterium]MCK6066689.1 fumarylacetoacetate hydrolase family protein [Microbacterium sp. EYE_512]QBR88016.1 FAA hydrolase family protein [Microbacterium wangchenii]TXK18194.1 fumarylacetoacetate hydrolase family protein [Microbacterium wangchenii]